MRFHIFRYILPQIKVEVIEEDIYDVTPLRIKKEVWDCHIEKNKHGSTLYRCEECGKDFEDDKCYIAHKKVIHERNRGHKCEFCNKYFKNKYYLATHRIQHTKVFKYKCDICKCGYLRLRDLKLHHILRHGTRVNFS